MPERMWGIVRELTEKALNGSRTLEERSRKREQTERGSWNRWLGAGAHGLGLANPSRSVDKLRLSTPVAIIIGSATNSVTDLLGTEALTLLVKG